MDDPTPSKTLRIPPEPEPALHGAGESGVGSVFAARPSDAGGWQPPTPEDLQLSFSQYEIRGILGCGGMGAVYKGWHKRLERFVAIKILPRLIDDGGMNFAERFKQEAAAMAKFRHPGIVAVHDAGETPDGLLYFTMELMEGTDVAQLVAKHGRLPVAQAVGIACRVCEALAYAHERGVIHRDIKPSNVMIEADGTVKLADFGLAKFPGAEKHVSTGSGLTIGTPDFMPPEALQGSRHVDHRGDIYATGGLLYQMLTGKVPHGRFEPPSMVIVGLDKRLDAIVDKAMQPDPEKRYASALEFLTVLTRIASTLKQPANGGTQTPGEPHRRSSARRVMIGLLLTVLLGIAAIAFGPWIKRYAGARAGNDAQANADGTKADGPSIPAIGLGPGGTPAIPTARWHDALAESPMKEVIAKAEHTAHGYLLPDNNHWPISPPSLRSGAVRVRATAFGGKFLSLYVPHNDRTVDRVRFRDQTQAWVVSHGTIAVAETDGTKMSGSSPLDGKPHDLLFARFGGRLRVMLDGHLLHDEVDPSSLPGRFLLDIFEDSKTSVEKVEYLELDGVPEAEALKLIGLDADGKELPAAKDAALAKPADATEDKPFVNTLGMKFVPVPIKGGPTDGKRVLFSVWETRVQDYEVFANETLRTWQRPDFEQGPDHPAVNVNWNDAQAICAWLTERERKGGRLGAAERYRLPTDHEWSCAAGIGDREDPALSPVEKSGKIVDVFPWGDAWPPPPGAGNYSGEEAANHLKDATQKILTGYRDDFPETAPAGSFTANQFGIFDLGGNAWEWCEDRWQDGDPSRVVRGASFRFSNRVPAFSSKRGFSAPEKTNGAYGFRVVLEIASSKPSAGSAKPAPRSRSLSDAATKDAPFENTLGMKFVPVPITGGPTNGKRVLFSVWETRVQDYEAFVAETKREWLKPKFAQGSTHPAVSVNWADVKAFCEWLTGRERKAGRLGATARYRLPTDHEWSCAVGIGELEDAAQTPKEKHCKIANVFPWGTAWPPPPGSGNFSGEESFGHGNETTRKFLAGYRDDFPETAPVGSFAANRFGLFDLEGNVREWCEALWDTDEAYRVTRGSAFNDGMRPQLLSSRRVDCAVVEGLPSQGFRLVLEDSSPAPTAAAKRWRDAFAESPLKEVIAKSGATADGYALPGENHWYISPDSRGSGAVRVRVTKAAGKFVTIFFAHDDHSTERIRFREQTGEWVLSKGTGGIDETDMAAKTAASPLDGQPHELVFARIGGRLRVLLDGQLLHDEADPSPLPGRFVLDLYRGAEICVDKVEYADLDGVPESEALALLRIGEK